MTEGELARVEAELGIVLPAAYRRLVVPFPVPAYAGNTDSELWDDPDRLVELNRELRAGAASLRPWPAHLFAMGRDGSGCASALDLREPEGPVWWADRCHLDAVGSGRVSATLGAWAGPYLADLRADLEANLIDPDGPPAARERAAEESARAGGRCVVVLVAAGAAVVLAVWGLFKWLGL